MDIFRAADRIAAPWKNGGGATQEVALCPVGAGWSDFQWRVSIATVAMSGAFSVFPEIDRSLAVLDGALRLTIAGVTRSVQRASSPPVRFDGAADTLGELVEGPVTDLNLMVRRGRCRGSLSMLDDTADRDISDRRILVATASIELPGIRLAAHDALSLMPGEEMPLLPDEATGWLIRIGG